MRKEIDRDEFMAGMLTVRENIKQQAANNLVQVEDAFVITTIIESTLVTIEEAECQNLRVRFFEEDGSYFYELKTKGKFGFEQMKLRA